MDNIYLNNINIAVLGDSISVGKTSIITPGTTDANADTDSSTTNILHNGHTSDGRSWVDYLKLYTGANVSNCSVSGSRLSHFTINYDRLNKVMQTNPDVIVVFGGVNDWGQANPEKLDDYSTDSDGKKIYPGYDIGVSAQTTIAAEMANHTFDWKVKHMIQDLLSGHPHITASGANTTPNNSTVTGRERTERLILFFTPLGERGFSSWNIDKYGRNTLGYTIQDYSDRIKMHCRHYAVPCIDLLEISGMTTEIPLHNLTLINKNNTYSNQDMLTKGYFHDGLHLNDNGQKKLAKIVAQKIIEFL